MILALSAGNTRIALAFFRDEDSLPLDTIFFQSKTLDNVQEIIQKAKDFLRKACYENISFTGAIYSSVVPRLDPLIGSFFREYNLSPVKVNIDMNTGLTFLYDNPRELGADRIVNSASAFHFYKKQKDLIIVDSGTALTFSVISCQGIFHGGLIFPGINSCMESLHQQTALLPRVPLIIPEKASGRSTVKGIQAGLYFGFQGLLSGIINKLENEYNRDFLIILTGGLAEYLGQGLKKEFILDKELNFKGLKLLYDLNK